MSIQWEFNSLCSSGRTCECLQWASLSRLVSSVFLVFSAFRYSLSFNTVCLGVEICLKWTQIPSCHGQKYPISRGSWLAGYQHSLGSEVQNYEPVSCSLILEKSEIHRHLDFHLQSCWETSCLCLDQLQPPQKKSEDFFGKGMCF